MSGEDSNRIAVCLIENEDNELLFGFRHDEQKWTNPSGHIFIGEDPYLGCQRELKEETGLIAQYIKLVKVEYVKSKGILLYLFKVIPYEHDGFDVSGDPDHEFCQVKFIDPNKIKDELFIPVEDNVAIKYWIDN